MAAAASKRSSSSVDPIRLSDLPITRYFALSLVAQIDYVLQNKLPREMGALRIYPVHFVIKGGAAAEIQLGTTNFADIDTGLYVTTDFSDKKRSKIRTNAINIVLGALINLFQQKDPFYWWSKIRSELAAHGFTFQSIPNHVMYERTLTAAKHYDEPAFVGKNGIELEKECPFRIWIRENVMAGETSLGMDLISIALNIDKIPINKQIILDIAIPHVESKNSHYEYKSSKPVIKLVDSVYVPVETPLALFIDQNSASRSSERNESKTVRRAGRADRILTSLLTPELAVHGTPLYKEMNEYVRFNDYIIPPTLPSGNRFRNIIQKVRDRAPKPELRTAPPKSSLPIITTHFLTPNEVRNLKKSSAAKSFTGGGGATRRIINKHRGRTQRRK